MNNTLNVARDRRGRLRSVLRGGLVSPSPFRPSLLTLLRRSRNLPVIMVHGFKYDPAARDNDNPFRSTFAHWRRDLVPERPTLGFGWWSCPGSPLGSPLTWLGSVFAAWRSGRWNTYRLCWDLAESAGQDLAEITSTLGPADVLAHSAGTRVVLEALAADPALPWRNVVLLNGAQSVGRARVIARRCPAARFKNFTVTADDVLRYFGGTFSPGAIYAPCIGLRGLGDDAPANWRDIALDSAEVQDWARSMGWPDVHGDNPKGVWDHWHSHKHPGNWGLIRACLAGEV